MTSTKRREELAIAVEVARQQLEIAERSWREANRKAREAQEAAGVAAKYHSECQQKLTDALRAAIAEEGAK